MKVAYLVNQYPQPSQSFIRREIVALEAAGVAVLRFTLRRWDGRLVDPDDERERGKTRAVLDAGAPLPAAVIGMPVGFVGAAESKEALAADGRVPFVIVRGRRGGSAMAVAAINALASERE